MINKKTLFAIRALLIAITSIAGVAFYLAFIDVIARSAQSALGLAANPAYTGGKVASVFQDPSGDDHGYGSLVYPEKSGSLDLVRYTVHVPVRNAKLTAVRDYWQLDFAFAGNDSPARNIRVYVDADGDGNGSLQTKKEFAEGIDFSPEHPWDFVLSVQGKEGSFRSADGTIEVPVVVTVSRSGKDVSVRIPLGNPAFESLYALSLTWHYVCVGAFDPAGRDGFARTGTSDFAPTLYDIIVPEGPTQEETLSAWDESSFRVPVISAITVSMRAPEKMKKQKNALGAEGRAKLNALEQAAAAEKTEAVERALASLDLVKPGTLDYALAAFNAGLYEKAEAAFDVLLAVNPNDSTANGYKGSLVALRAGKAMPLAAVGIVKEAYVFLDRAVSLAKTSAELDSAYTNRGNVSMAIPETVFGKAEEGALDFIASAEARKLLATTSSSDITSLDVASSYCDAAQCYEIADKGDLAETAYAEARRLVDAASPGEGARLRLVLFRHYEMVKYAREETESKKDGKKEKRVRPSAETEADRKSLAEILGKLDALNANAPSGEETKLAVAALELEVMKLDEIEQSLEFAAAHESALSESVMGQLFVAVAECKMATVVKSDMDKVEWINRGMGRFEKANRKWPSSENVYTYMALTYSNFPPVMAMREQTVDLLSAMQKNYASGVWQLSDGQADLLWITIKNLCANYRKGEENKAILGFARGMRDALPIMASRPMAQEVLHE